MIAANKLYYLILGYIHLMITEYQYIIFIFLLILCFYIVSKKFKERGMVYCKSVVDDAYYLVRDRADKNRAANLLATIKKNIFDITQYMYNRLIAIDSLPDIDRERYASNKQYIEQLNTNISNVVIMESSDSSKYTSYSVNKGEEIVFCIRSKTLSNLIDGNDMHDTNLIMYVALHEISHVACPEKDHTPLFLKIFNFICNEAVTMGIYKKINFNDKSEEYCGMMITDSII